MLMNWIEHLLPQWRWLLRLLLLSFLCLFFMGTSDNLMDHSTSIVSGILVIFIEFFTQIHLNDENYFFGFNFICSTHVIPIFWHFFFFFSKKNLHFFSVKKINKNCWHAQCIHTTFICTSADTFNVIECTAETTFKIVMRKNQGPFCGIIKCASHQNTKHTYNC